MGYEVILATSGDDAFEILQGTPRLELIVTDVRMPDVMNGFDLIELALARHPTPPEDCHVGYTGEITPAYGARPHVRLRLGIPVS
jgi:CheY-like chemotaxis protein